ncbi:MAG: archaeal heat shock protein Hsp20 [Promethearchaeota archaeon]
MGKANADDEGKGNEKKGKEKKSPGDPWDPFGPFGPYMSGSGGFDFSEFFKNFNRMFQDPNFFRPFQNMIRDIMEQVKLDPEAIANAARDWENMSEEERRKLMPQVKGPFVYGFNLSFGPDGTPRFDSFGNVHPKPGKTEVKDTRDPLVDVFEEDDTVVVVAEIPGVSKGDIKLSATETSLTIKAEARDGKRRYEKTIPLTAEINPDVAKARYQNGILEVRLQKVGPREQRGSEIPVD